MRASMSESSALANRWSNTNAAYWDVDGVSVYIGTPKQLDEMGQKAYEQVLQKQVCAYGAHEYLPNTSDPYRIWVLTAGKWTRTRHCKVNNGKYLKLSAKQNEVTLVHEVLETLVDPKQPVHKRRVNGHLAEVCDPVHTVSKYDAADGSWIPNFVYPSYFKGGAGPYDFFGKLKKPI